jgi:uncharacterized protein YlxW (UPF0749 family)
MRPPSRLQTKIAAGLVAAAVGFLVGIQVGERGSTHARLASERPEDLTRILADLNEEADSLGRQVAALRVRLLRYRSSSQSDELARRDLQETVGDLQVLSGVVPAEGPGIRITIDDPHGDVTWDALLDLVQELRDAGAEAIAINRSRVVASTWLGPGDGGVAVDGRTVAAPYEVVAIGAAEGMREALGIPGGPLTVLEALPEVRAEVAVAEALRVPALRHEITFQYARPAA